MKSFCAAILAAVATALFVGCAGPVANTNTANGNTTSAGGQSAAANVETLKELESRAFEAYRNKDGKFFEGFLTEKFVASSSGRRVDRALMIKTIAEYKCDVKSFSFSDEKLTNVGVDTAIITMKVTTEGVCGSEKMPSPFISASLYVRNGIEWKAAWHGEVPVVDPKAPSANVDDKKSLEPPTKPETKELNAETAVLASMERSVWEGWMKRDAKKLDALTARELAFVNIFGGYFKNRAETLKDWSENPCRIKSVDVADASSVSVTNDTSILIHKGTANGTCFGQTVGPVLGTSIYVKEGPAWKLAFTMNMPAR